MKFNIKSTFLFILLIPNFAMTANWSRYIKTQNQDDVSISFRQQKQNNQWLVEWQVQNTSAQTIEPILVARKYSCTDGNTINLETQSMGIYLPNTQRHGDIKDDGICPNSKIELVEIQTEIHEISID